jgi:hypothetical protein
MSSQRRYSVVVAYLICVIDIRKWATVTVVATITQHRRRGRRGRRRGRRGRRRRRRRSQSRTYIFISPHEVGALMSDINELQSASQRGWQ